MSEMSPDEIMRAELLGTYMRERAEAKAAAAARAAVLAGPRAGELVELELRAATLRERQHGLAAIAADDGRTFTTDEGAEFDGVQAEVDALDAKAKALVREHSRR